MRRRGRRWLARPWFLALAYIYPSSRTQTAVFEQHNMLLDHYYSTVHIEPDN